MTNNSYKTEALMNKFIQLWTMFALLLTFSVVTAFADSVRKFEAQIPFEFYLGQKSYPAGKYLIKITKLNTGSMTISLEDENGSRLYNGVVMTNGDATEDEYRLVFNNYENQRFLSKILTPDKGYSVPESKIEKTLARKNRRLDLKKQTAILTPVK